LTENAGRENAGHAINSLRSFTAACVIVIKIFMSLAKCYCSSAYLFSLKSHRNHLFNIILNAIIMQNEATLANY